MTNHPAVVVFAAIQGTFWTHIHVGTRFVSRNRDGEQCQASQPKVFLCGGRLAFGADTCAVTLQCSHVEAGALQPVKLEPVEATVAGRQTRKRVRQAADDEDTAFDSDADEDPEPDVSCRRGNIRRKGVAARAEEAEREGPPAAGERLVRLSAALAAQDGLQIDMEFQQHVCHVMLAA